MALAHSTHRGDHCRTRNTLQNGNRLCLLARHRHAEPEHGSGAARSALLARCGCADAPARRRRAEGAEGAPARQRRAEGAPARRRAEDAPARRRRAGAPKARRTRIVSVGLHPRAAKSYFAKLHNFLSLETKKCFNCRTHEGTHNGGTNCRTHEGVHNGGSVI